MNPELEMKISSWRQACSAGTMSPQDMADAIGYLRSLRGSIKEPAPKASAGKPKASAADVQSALAGFGAMKKAG
jgi:hypothetical protein